MRLYKLAEGFKVKGGDTEITGIVYDSRLTKKGDLFIALRGRRFDGHEFIGDVIKKGAHALCVEKDENYPIPYILVKNTREAMGILAARFYNYPSTRVRTIAITGTNGKTTTAFIIKDMLEFMGEKVGLLGTIHYCNGEICREAERTTPESVDIQRFLKEAEDTGCRFFVMEASSAGIEEKRLVGTQIHTAIFTNFSREHLEYHGTMENYLNAKLKLFREYSPEYSIINEDDPHASLFKENQKNVFTFGFSEGADIRAEIKTISLDGTLLNLHGLIEEENIYLPIPGKFNVYNMMAALLTLHVLKIPVKENLKAIIQSIKGIPGRFEVLKGSKCDINVIIDYAHTPEALENLLESIRTFRKKRVITVFGAGGDRDRGKRPLFGNIAEKLSDFMVITSDNPRNEDPESIIQDIIAGIKGANFITIIDRKDAIYYAIEHAQPGDIIVIAGKGHETYQEIKDKKYPFSDKEISLEALRRRGCLN